MPQRLVTKLGEFDIRDRIAPIAPAWVTQIAFAMFCLGLTVILRFIINQFAPGAAPFALIHPAALAGTLFAGWQCGVLVLVLGQVLAWYFVVPVTGSFDLLTPHDGPRMAVNALTGLGIILLADIFRRAARNAAQLRDLQVQERDLLLREIDHRIKNNFMMVASLVDIQRRRSDNKAVKEALAAVLARIESFTRAHQHLYHTPGKTGAVHMQSYISELCDALAQALTLHGAIALSCSADDVEMDRDRAVAVGLLINELVTNAAKHAFEGRESGRIVITFGKSDGGWRLIVEDDGVGMRPETDDAAGLGQRLIEAFVRQADGDLAIATGEAGTRVTIDLKP